MEHQAVLNDKAEAFLGERVWGGDGDIGLNVEVHTSLGEPSAQIWKINPACTEPPGLPWSELYPGPKQFNYYNVGLQRSTFPRRFTITKKGYMGLTPPKAQVGDSFTFSLVLLSRLLLGRWKMGISGWLVNVTYKDLWTVKLWMICCPGSL
jgi:hypothetical protein